MNLEEHIIDLLMYMMWKDLDEQKGKGSVGGGMTVKRRNSCWF